MGLAIRWTPEEISILARILAMPKRKRPPTKTIAKSLPGRSVGAIIAQQSVMRKAGQGLWNDEELAILRHSLPEDKASRKSYAEIFKLLPDRSYYSINVRIAHMGLPKPIRKDRVELAKWPWPEGTIAFENDWRAFKEVLPPMPRKISGFGR